MAPKGKGSGNHGGAFNFGVDAGEEVVSEHARWDLVQIPVGCILEVCLQGSSIGLGAEDWFALVVDEVSGDHHQGFFIGGAFLGTESVIYEEEIATSLKEGKVHLRGAPPIRAITSLSMGSSMLRGFGYGDHRQIKHDPGDPGDDPEEDESSSSSSGESSDPGEKSEAESELSFEAPLRKRAHRDPGSVMSMLVRHAQEQLDRGALLEQEGAQAGLTSGVKISTYFALLIRPYHQAGSPLLRELYALGQAIDLLRAGRLPETADALASRFISVHTALTDGNWSTASHLELYPLEPVQSTSTATMLEAQKHKRLVLKSQGYAPSGRWWSPTGRGKGGAQVEKGKKGNTKDRNKGKGKSNTKDGGWSSKSDPNPWKENKDEAPKK